MTLPIVYRKFFEDFNTNAPDQFWGNEGAGALFVAKDTGRILLFLRSDAVNEPNTWNLVGGKIDSGENPKEAVAREVEEETGYSGDYKMSLLYTFRHRNFKYHNFLVLIPFEFTPELNWEHSTSQWVEYGDWPSPLHFGLNDLIKHAGHKIKRVIDVIKKKKAKMFEVDAPPAIIHQVGAPKKVGMMNPQQMHDAYIVAATLWREAAGEGKVGMQAILNVIMNRSKGDFGDAKNTVLRSKQFSTWNNVSNPGKVAIDIAKENRDDKTYRAAIQLVDLAMKGKLPDITNGATFYVNPKKVTPYWRNEVVKTKEIGRHHFYKRAKLSKIKENYE